MDEDNFAIAYNDVDWCLKAHKSGFKIVWSPFACMIHHESVSRGYEVGSEKQIRFEREKEALRSIHNTSDFSDPSHSPWLTVSHSNPRFQYAEKMPSVRYWQKN